MAVPYTLSRGYNISHKLLRPSQFLEKFMEILEWFTLPKQIRSLLGGVGIVSEFMSGIVLKKQMKKKGFGKNLHFFNLNSLFLMIGI